MVVQTNERKKKYDSTEIQICSCHTYYRHSFTQSLTHSYAHIEHGPGPLCSFSFFLSSNLKSFLLDVFFPPSCVGQTGRHKAEELSSMCCWRDKAFDSNANGFYLIALTANWIGCSYSVASWKPFTTKLRYCIKREAAQASNNKLYY